MLELNVSFGATSLKLADLLAFFLFFGVVGKSAQFGLHT
jgi:NADH:ubiquinone oxidoreductase subunit 5 (subunit L)/multisubunit Na+/H+ antiporter MnhA subunit